MIVNAENLAQFVADSDALGGPGAVKCSEFWRDFRYQPSSQVSDDLDPFSEAYVAEQMCLYEEIAKRPYEVLLNEKTSLDVKKHTMAPNPYDHPDPSALAVHVQRLARAFTQSGARRGDLLIDMGCGWGLSSEIAAYLGLSVKSVDVNADFVALVNNRAQAGGLDIEATHSTFEDFKAQKQADLILFYECFHHAVRPWVVLDNVSQMLKNGGRLLLAGEPIDEVPWKHWGLRMDALSIYCIHKFGWFESGWSLRFLKDALLRSGFLPRIFREGQSELGLLVVAAKSDDRRIAGNEISGLFESANTSADGADMGILGVGFIDLVPPSGSQKLTFCVANYSGRPLRAHFRVGSDILFSGELQAGETELSGAFRDDGTRLDFHVERWMPDEEVGNGDLRIIGAHLRWLKFEPTA